MNSQYPGQLVLLRRHVFGLILFAALLATAMPVQAQGDQPAAPSPTPLPAPTPIPASQIPARTGEVAGFLRGIEANARSQDEITEVEGPSAPITDSADVEDSDGEAT